MLNGGLLYLDFIDVKPPLVYLIYGLGGSLFGSTEFAFRLFDLLWQSATIALLILYMRNRQASQTWVSLSVVLYAMLYVTLGFAPNAQPETLLALPLLGILMSVDRERSWSRDLLLGALSGIIFMLKYPLAIVAPACILLFVLRGDGLVRTLSSTVRMLVGSVVVIAAVIWPMLADPRFLPAFTDLVHYLGVYTNNSGWNIALLTSALKVSGSFFGDHVSIAVCAAIVIGILASQRSLITTPTVFALLLVVSIIVERKFQPHHFGRLYLPLSVIGGLGLQVLATQARRLFADQNLVVRYTIAGMAVILVAFSPIPRYVNLVRLSASSAFDPHVYTQYLTQLPEGDRDYVSIETLRTYLQQRLSADDKILVVSQMATPIVPFLPTKHVGPFADAHFYLGVGATPTWKGRAAQVMSNADWIVVDTNDVNTGMTLHNRTSWEGMQADSVYRVILAEQFKAIDTVACYYVFKRES